LEYTQQLISLVMGSLVSASVPHCVTLCEHLQRHFQFFGGSRGPARRRPWSPAGGRAAESPSVLRNCGRGHLTVHKPNCSTSPPTAHWWLAL